MGKLYIDLRKLVVRKVADGWSQRMIAKHLNISHCAVQNIIKKIKENGTIDSGCKNKSEESCSGTLERLEIRFANLNQYYEEYSYKNITYLAALQHKNHC